MTREENEKRLAHLKNIVLSMPEQPGSYQFYDEDKTIIYVGKAKKLKSRVSTYFHKEVDRYKTKVLVSKIHDITYTVVNTEEDALLLENSLIKKYNPRYNVLLKDGKTYPSICVRTNTSPASSRPYHQQEVRHLFRPLSSHRAMYNVLELINKIYKPRSCASPSPRGCSLGQIPPCLEYHIHNCEAAAWAPELRRLPREHPPMQGDSQRQHAPVERLALPADDGKRQTTEV
jgi:excinuclease ABC subunit C